jgi:predicted ribosome quality control (RQC) complex YloA/Tae2 family protein
MREISALELSILAQELQEFKGFHIDKFYEIGPGSYRMRISKDRGHADILCILKKMVCKASSVEAAETPTSFAMGVRKRISGFIIDSIGQMANDRILVFRLSKRDEKASMIFEMMGKGNLILTDKEMKITLASLQVDFKDRSMRVGNEYAPPKNEFVTYENLEDLTHRINDSEKGMSLISVISRNINLGALYLEDALIRAGLDPRAKLSSISGTDAKKAIEGIREEIQRSKAGRYLIYLDGASAVDYSVCDIKKYSGLESKAFGSLQETLDAFYGMEPAVGPVESKAEKELRASIERQKDLITSTAKEIESNKEIGEAIFNNMNNINLIIEELKRNKRITADELQAHVSKIKILGVDLKEKKVTIEID